MRITDRLTDLTTDFPLLSRKRKESNPSVFTFEEWALS
ncbi:hypothetical protein JCM19294_185 [Nonlabens tegetincola]|uniref:Uncharacterized protein n=1 Tax=Nonlabens tegetincola TaxID=323273 RepID=A0A090Q3I7_9FLAO|nr:hypothetical protein JCM19294_185 [Nonlabens tegetincola]